MTDTHVRVEVTDHPEGTVRLWVKDKHVNLTAVESVRLAADLTGAATPVTSTPSSAPEVTVTVPDVSGAHDAAPAA